MYVHCEDLDKLSQPEERDYMEQNWRLKETQVLRSYTRYYANLGAYSTQRNEGHHVVVKQFLNPQITLEQATLRLAEHLNKQPDDWMRRKLNLERSMDYLADIASLV
ncbi:hypothetical protein BDZ91DRAFT_768837 [Kalaharituber pfeilii]|nr:hypothetical protein BDZ91DRAFT_768837 [Kalaharituber pfeilii]